MSNKKHIDRLFQEKFKDFEKTPRDMVWSNIKAQLNENKKQRIIPIWWRYVGIAALLLLLLTVGNSVFNSQKSNHIKPANEVVGSDAIKKRSIILEPENTTNKINNAKSSDNNVVLSQGDINEKPSNKNALQKTLSKNNVKPHAVNSIKKTTVTVNSLVKNKTETQKNNSLIANQSKTLNQLNSTVKESLTSHSILNTIGNNDTQLAQATYQKLEDTVNNISIVDDVFKNKNITVATIKTENPAVNNLKNLVVDSIKQDEGSEIETIEEAIAKNKEATAVNKEKQLNRWRVNPNVAPVYFNTLGKGASIGGQFNNNSKTGEVNLSYGINASYAISEKLVVRSGINRVNLGYNTNNVAVFDRANTRTVNTLSTVRENQNNDIINSNIETNVSLISIEALRESAITLEAFSSISTANINQSLGFIEVPIEFQYIVLDKKIGVNIIGGFSSFFLNNNELFSLMNNTKVLIGEALNVNNISYSANFGLGLNYKMTKKINFNFEPTFKYQINTFNNATGDFKPYFIGVYTGVGFRF